MILQRIEGERFSRVLPAWRGRAAVLLAGGPSLTEEQFEAVRVARETDGVRAIAINDSYLRAPWADVHYAADAKWHRWHTEGIEKPLIGLTAADVRERWAAFAGQKCTAQSSAAAVPDAVHVMRCREFSAQTIPLLEPAISNDPTVLMSGRHSGFQALNLAILAGATTIILLGYDAKRGADGRPHWHGDHPTPSPADATYPEFRRAFSAAENDIVAAGVRVINCSPGSAIESFPKMALEDALGAVA